MKKVSSRILHYTLGIFVMAAVLFTSTTAFALRQHEQIMSDADLTTVKRLAVARPNHYKVETLSDEPSFEALIEIMGTANKMSNFYVIPYAEIVESIKKDAGVDITSLDYREYEKVFAENVGKYADAFVILTTANNNDPTIFMFTVKDAQTKNIMYDFAISNRWFSKNIKGYTSACESFYKAFSAAIEKSAKDKNKQKK